MILIDSNVAIDVLDTASPFHQWSRSRLFAAMDEGVFFNVVVMAELAGRANSFAELERMLKILDVPAQPMGSAVAYRAGRAFKAWVRNGGRRGVMLPDLLIGAHASVENASVLTRDPRRFRTYFPEVKLITPELTDDN